MLNGCLADTDYFEIEAASGRQYGVWVTTPPGYAESEDSFPLIYVLDGNWSVGLTAPLIVTQADPFLTVAPYVQVSIGYAGADAARWSDLRNRDLVPPGEPIGDEMKKTLTELRDAGTLTPERFEAYAAQLSDTHADEFLSFLTEQLHPVLQTRLRVSDSGHGLFGYSYGGLFALYAWLLGATPFASFGAGSPGVVGPDSQIFPLIEALPERTAAFAQRLHLTVNEVETVGVVPIYRRLASHFLAVVDRLLRSDRADDVSTALMQETHVTGLQASFLSYLKHCHSRSTAVPPGLSARYPA